MSDCIFCKFINKEINPITIYEDKFCIVVMDKFPLTRGQTLIIGKSHTDYLFDLNDEEYSHCMLVAKNVAKATDLALNTVRCWMLIQGLEVAHNHIKILPMYKDIHIPLEEGTGKEVDDTQLEELAQLIRDELEK
jgi:histidine triad (HIT) family protein